MVLGVFAMVPKSVLLGCSDNNYYDIDSLINASILDYTENDGIGINQILNSNYNFIEKDTEIVQLQGVNVSANKIFIISQNDIIVKISLIVSSKTLNDFKNKLKESGKKIEIEKKNSWGIEEIINNNNNIIELCDNNTELYNQIVIKSLNTKGII